MGFWTKFKAGWTRKSTSEDWFEFAFLSMGVVVATFVYLFEVLIGTVLDWTLFASVLVVFLVSSIYFIYMGKHAEKEEEGWRIEEYGNPFELGKDKGQTHGAVTVETKVVNEDGKA